MDLRVKGFSFINWLSSSNYIGNEKIGKEQCWKFAMTANETFSNNATAWISLSTSYPVKVLIGESIYDFSPVTSFTESVMPPPEYQAVLDADRNQANALKMMMQQGKGTPP